MSSDETSVNLAEREVNDEPAAESLTSNESNDVESNPDDPQVEETTAGPVNEAAEEPAAETAPDSPTEDSPPAQQDSAAPEADGTKGETTPPAETAAKRRVRLNPTFQPGAATAGAAAAATESAPTEASSEERPPATETAEDGGSPKEDSPNDESTPAESSRPEAVPETPAPPKRPGPVEVPRADENLDAELEAELAAAMEGGDLNAAGPAPQADAEEAADAVQLPENEEDLESGQRLTGKIQSIHGDDVFVDVGYRSPGVLPMRQFTASRKPLVGQMIEVVFDKLNAEEGLIQLSLPRGVRRAGGDWESVSTGQIVECIVVKTNKGGLEVNVGNLRGFMPASQVDFGFVSDLEQFVGQKLRGEVTECVPKKRKLVVSRRKIVAAEREEMEAELWKKLSVGQNYPGTVKTVKNYGAFVDIGGVDGFLHIGEISHSRIRHPSDVVSEGQEVHVQVISLDPDKKKIGLGMKQLIADPWQAVSTNYPAETIVSGKVTRVADFGAFVELEPGVEGLVHISEIDHSRVGRVADVLKVGQEIEAKVLEVDPDRNRISLSIKALKAMPESNRDQSRDPAPEPYERKRKGPLKGGTSDTLNQGGGLFGNPNDFGS